MTLHDPKDPAAAGWLDEIFPSFQGEGIHAGRRQLFLRLAGCGLGCRFCDTPRALRRGAACSVRAPGAAAESLLNPLLPERAARVIADLASRSGPCHALAVTGGEPLEQEAFLAALLPLLCLPVLLETAGTLPEALARVIGQVRVVSMDLKLPSVAGIAPCFELHRRFLEIARTREVYVKVVVNAQVDAAEWRAAARLVAEVAPAIPFIVQPETDRRGRCRVDFERLFALAAEASAAGLADVRVLPQVHKMLGAP